MIGNKIINFKQLDSTNDYIKQNIVDLSDGTIVVASQQTNGRGRRGNIWHSPKGNLYFSVLLKGCVNREDMFLLTMKSSLSIVLMMEQYGLKPKIKYPNDILINNKKISGILIESIGYKELEAVVVGIGINVNVMDFSNVDWKATSMKKETNETYHINDVLKEFIQCFNSIKDDNVIYENYLNRSILLNKTIIHNGKDYIVESIEKYGDIILMSDQETITVPSDELSISNFY